MRMARAKQRRQFQPSCLRQLLSQGGSVQAAAVRLQERSQECANQSLLSSRRAAPWLLVGQEQQHGGAVMSTCTVPHDVLQKGPLQRQWAAR